LYVPDHASADLGASLSPCRIFGVDLGLCGVDGGRVATRQQRQRDDG